MRSARDSALKLSQKWAFLKTGEPALYPTYYILYFQECIVTTSAVLSSYLKSIELEGKVYVIGSSGIGQELDLVGISHIGIGVSWYYYTVCSNSTEWNL